MAAREQGKVWEPSAGISQPYPGETLGGGEAEPLLGVGMEE